MCVRCWGLGDNRGRKWEEEAECTGNRSRRWRAWSSRRRRRLVPRHGGHCTTYRALPTTTLRKCHTVRAPLLHHTTTISIITTSPLPLTTLASPPPRASQLPSKAPGRNFTHNPTLNTKTKMTKTTPFTTPVTPFGCTFSSFCFSCCFSPSSLWSSGVPARATSLMSLLRYYVLSSPTQFIIVCLINVFVFFFIIVNENWFGQW